MISYLDAHPRAKEMPDLSDQPPLIRAMQICAQVAQIAHEKGYQWHTCEMHPITSPMNHQWKRNVLKAAWRKREQKRVELQRCPTCTLFYITSISWLRCQCKVTKPITCQYCDETHNVMTLKHVQGLEPDIHICRDCYECGMEPKLMEAM